MGLFLHSSAERGNFFSVLTLKLSWRQVQADFVLLASKLVDWKPILVQYVLYTRVIFDILVCLK